MILEGPTYTNQGNILDKLSPRISVATVEVLVTFTSLTLLTVEGFL